MATRHPRHPIWSALVLRTVPAASLGLGLLCALYGVGFRLSMAPAARPASTAAFLSALLLFGLALSVWRRPPSPVFAHPIAAAIAVLVMGNGLLLLGVIGDPSLTTNVATVMVGAGLALHSLPWLAAVQSTAVVSWMLVATRVPGLDVPGQLTTLVLPAVAITTVIVLIRRAVFGRFDDLRRESEAKAAELSESQERYELAVAGSLDGLYDWDIDGRAVHYSERWKAILGYRVDEVGTSIDESLGRVHPDDYERVRARLVEHLKGETPFFEDEYRMLHRDGTYLWVLCRGASTRDAAGRAVRMAGSLTDMSRRGVFDALTGLPNRRLLVDRLSRLTSRPRGPEEEDAFALLFLDLDDFKRINDTLGHHAGDEILLEVARRLQSCVRASDTVSRLGGDEFVVLLDRVKVPEGVSITVDRIVGRLAEPFRVDERELFLTTSMGAVVDTSSYDSPEEILRDADTAMYKAKEEKDRFIVFDESMRERLSRRLRLETELRRALRDEEFRVHYQSIVSLATGAVEGFEALVRWNHPTRGILTPRDFIPIMEETGLIVQLGEWVLREACSQVSGWLADRPAGPRYSLSVNLSGRQLTQGQFASIVTQVLEETGFPPDQLKLEITETAVILNPTAAADTLRRIRALGVRIMMDDFGTGHSSLSYLQNLPIDTLKIDRSFISRIDADPESSELVLTIIRMASALGLNVVAEGIETEEQLRVLKAMDCAFGQGFLFHRPSELSELEPHSAAVTAGAGSGSR